RAARRRTAAGLADSIERIAVKAFLARWLCQPLFASLDPAAAGRASRSTNTAAVLTSPPRKLGTGTQQPLWSRLHELTMPVLVVVGEGDHKFAALGRRLVGSIGANADLAVVPGAGHACHLARPDAFAAVVLPFVQ